MTDQNQTEPEEIEQGDYINSDNVAGWDEDNPDKRYKSLNTSPRHTQAGQEGYLLKDTVTNEIHISNLDTNLSNPDYKITSTNVTLTIDGVGDVTNIITDELRRGVQYDYTITSSKVRVEYQTGESGWDDEAGTDDWDVVATVETDRE